MQTKILLFFIFLPFAYLTSNFYTNIPYNKSSGIFYNNLGEAKIENSKLTLLAHINVTHLNKAFDKAKHFYAKSLNLCTTALNDKRNHNFVSFHCELTLKLIKEQLAEITNKAEILSHITGRVISPRRRRGLVNGVSYALNWLFGTPDADDAKYYTDSINTLLSDNRQTQTLLKSQIQVITSTIKNFNNSVASLKENEEQMNSNIKLINKLAIETNSYIETLNLETLITQQTMTDQ